MTGTIFHGSKVPLRTWLFVLFEMCANKNGMAAREIERKYGVAPKTAWFMAHRLREAMKVRAPGMLVGTIVSDETWIGGTPRNRHKAERAMARGFGYEGHVTDKTPVLSLINAETGEVALGGGTERDRPHASQGHVGAGRHGRFGAVDR